jgi:hypothetical protein
MPYLLATILTKWRKRQHIIGEAEAWIATEPSFQGTGRSAHRFTDIDPDGRLRERKRAVAPIRKQRFDATTARLTRSHLKAVDRTELRSE